MDAWRGAIISTESDSEWNNSGIQTDQSGAELEGSYKFEEKASTRLKGAIPGARLHRIHIRPLQQIYLLQKQSFIDRT